MQLTAKVEKIIPVAENTFEVVFHIPNPEFKFKAGQYISVTLPTLKNLPMKEQFRDFSIASSPHKLPKLAISFRASESIFKKTLLKMSPGDEVLITGPSGVFTLPDNFEKSLVFIAGGIGIDPFLSMLEFATKNKLEAKITLIYCNKSPASAPYLIELEDITRENSNIKIIKKFGLLEEDDIKVINSQDSLWYVAGPPGMVHAARTILTKLGIMDNDIKTEEFTGY